MKLNKSYIRQGGRVLLVLAFMVMAIAFTDRVDNGDTCNELVINILNQTDNYYLDESDVSNLVTDHGQTLVTGQPFSELNLKEMEGKVREEPFVEDVEIYRDLKGNLIVNVDLKRPMARIIRSGAPHAYIAEDGTIMPVSEKFTSRVVLVSGKYADKLIAQKEEDAESNEQVLQMLRTVYEDPFWSGQVAQIDIDKNLNMTIYPQVTKQRIEFGKPVDLEEKFAKLMIFYKKILPSKGWNTYDRVNVEFKDQIIAE
ncbi:cell division protein FtsQ/DivIB [Fulvivirga sedimenti]|uniref:Cell division protein FtsQ n=1 Tax=Fulvivirga sedimenti TaxID=2879465 RepID=A0A9X1KX65_9BACT|nr:cell division protein FtsQ [Fulvivirga sedimenti]MCA6073922.1 cell division protein FtsQ [Fulvivirga sedimenti]